MAVQQKRKVADSLAQILVDRYGVRRVCLVGSLARGEGSPVSDIDLVVEGLSPTRYFEALAELWYLLPPETELDLIPLEFASPAMADAVSAEGVLLCARA